MKYKKILVAKIFITILVLMSCGNKPNENSLIEDGFQRHEVVIEDKCISFILPICYSDTFRTTNWGVASRWAGQLRKHIFYSMENDRNAFAILLYDMEKGFLKKEEMEEFYMYEFLHWRITSPNFDFCRIVPFMERQKDETGQIYYLSMGSAVFPLYDEQHLEKDEQHLIWSEFYCRMCPKKSISKYFSCELITNDKIKDFSYEEKRKIMESIRIEDVKPK
jgi:hypothetical protein